MSADGPFFGIDFGTTNSSMAWYDPENKRAEVIRNADGEYKTSSLVYFGEEGTLVGRPVEDLLEEVEQTNDPEERDGVTSRIVKSIKRSLINPPVIPLPGGKVVRPVEVVAEILGKLKRDAEDEFFHEPVTQVVVTCPAVFDTKEQQVLREAAAKVGFERVEVLDEPTAAAITVTKRARKVGNGVLVYDLGAGTFDLSVVTRAGDGAFYSPVDPQGDPRCGGDDLDLALYRYCEEIAREQLGRTISLTGDVDQVFLKQCRARKENLTKRNKVRFASLLASENGPVSFKYEVERETFEGLIRSRLEGTATKTAQLFEQVKDRVDTVILIGGSSQVPLVERLLEEKLPVEPRKFAEKEYAVALGSAYHAHEVFGGVPGPVKEYRKALKICWEDRRLTETEIEWLASLKEKLDLDPETAARVERQVMGATIEEVLEHQIKFAREQYRRVVELGWKDNKLEALKRTPPARLDMLLDNRELFHDYDFDDCPVSAAERKALAGNMPWAVFVMAARVATDSNLSSAVVADRLRTMADELGMNEEQAREAERDVLGGPTVKDLLELRGQEAVPTALREYRKKVTNAWRYGKLDHEKVKKLRESASSLGLSKDQAEGVERSVMDNTAYEILAEDNAVLQLLQKHKIDRSKIKGSGKNGRITKRDVESYVQEMKQEEKKRQEWKRKVQEEKRRQEQREEEERKAREAARPKLDLSKLRGDLDKHGDGFVSQCESGAKKTMASADWQNKLGECLAPALAEYAKEIEKEAQSEVDKLKLGLKVPAFAAPKLSKQIEAGKTTSVTSNHGDHGEVAGMVAGALAGAAVGSIVPVIGTGIGGVIGAALGAAAGEAAGEGIESKTVTLDKGKSLENVRRAARALCPALKEEANKYLDKVQSAVATAGGKIKTGEDEIVEQLNKLFGV